MIDIKNFQQMMDGLDKELAKFKNGSDKFVTVGIHEAAGNVESGDLTMASLGATHHFGATINHPGGTDYGYATKADEKAKRVRFLKSGSGAFKVIGKTEPHKITIPARPWLDVGVISGVKEYINALEDLQPESIEQALEIVGIEATASVKQYMRDLQTPPNARSTVKKKGSSNPLIDTGEMLGSVDFAITSEKPEEGL